MATNKKVRIYQAASTLMVPALLLWGGSCSHNPVQTAELLQAWQGPYGGVPPWDRVKPQDFPAAFDAAIAEATQELAAIAANPEAPTFENTFVPMEKAGQSLDRLMALYGVHASNLSVGDMPRIESEISPKLAAYRDSITQNTALFARIEKVHSNAKTLNADEARLVDTTYKSFIRQGAKLTAAQKAQLSEINQKLSRLSTQFAQNVLHDEKQVTWIDKESDLAGLSPGLVSGYAKAAQDLGKPGKWAVRNTRSAVDPFLTFAENRDLRKQVWKRFIQRGDNLGEHDNNAIIQQIAALRAERAKLLGYQSHAHLTLENRMAKTPEAALELMEKVWPKAVDRVNEEVADMQAIATAEGQNTPIEGWDYRFYAEKVRKDKYALDSNEVRQYLQLDKLVEAIHWMAKEVFALVFTPISDLPVFHADVTVYKVTDRAGKLVGLWYLDPYAREGKRSGAWMTSYRSQQNIDGNWVTPIVSNNSNFVKADAGTPVLVSWSDAVTLFHEFGHALHGLSSRVTYPSQSGTRVARDYVEFPSQLIEHWFPTREVLSRFALHYETGKPMPEELVEKIEKASKFNQGFDTVEYLSAALVDMKLHLESDKEIDPKAFEQGTLAAIGMPKQIAMRHRLPHFLHLFSGGYEAGYYSYLWSDALTADAADLFEAQAKSYYDKEVAAALIKHIFSVGDTVDPAESFRRFRGRDVDTKALLRKRGFPTE